MDSPSREATRLPFAAEIIGRDGKPMPYRCNLPAGHLSAHAQTYETATATTTT